MAPWRPDAMTSAEGRAGFKMTSQATRRSGGPIIRVGARVFMGLPPGAGQPSRRAAGIINSVTGDGPKPDQSAAWGAGCLTRNLRFQAS